MMNKPYCDGHLKGGYVDKQARMTVELFAAKVGEQFDVTRLVLFGSRARGDNHDESDADVAVFLKGNGGDFVEVKLAMANIAFDVLLETGVRIQPLPIWNGEWEHPNRYSNPHLLHNIAKDGVEFVKVSEDCWEVLEAVDDVNRLRGIVVSKRAVSVEEMDSAIRHRSG
jgi:antitoxin ChpS